ncbi:MAG: DUF5683 domain-containing protein [Bacteroidales bacterium]
MSIHAKLIASTTIIRKYKPIILVFLMAIVSLNVNAQSDTVRANNPREQTNRKNKVQPIKDTTTKKHSPKKAARLSAMLPGLGQAYNEKYWKIPVVYAALGTSTYFIINNNKEYKKYKKAYIARTDNDSSTVTSLKFTTENIKLRRDYYRRNLELSIVATVGIYVLNIVDATVDAHLFDFNVNENLSMRIEPEVNAFMPGRKGGLKISLYF